MGLFFAPLISAVTLLKLVLVFYLRILYLKYLCKPSNSRYEVRLQLIKISNVVFLSLLSLKASRTSSLLNYFLLFSFLMSTSFLAYIVGDMYPSNACGPFRDKNDAHYYTGVVANLIDVSTLNQHCSEFYMIDLCYTGMVVEFWKRVPPILRSKYRVDRHELRYFYQTFFLFSFISVYAVILLLTYFHLYLNYSVLNEYNTRISKQLKSIVDETKSLKMKLDEHKNQNMKWIE